MDALISILERQLSVYVANHLITNMEQCDWSFLQKA